MFRRETIIALRARHQAYRIASEVIHPHVQGPRPPEPPIPIDPPDFSPFRRQIATPAMIMLAALVWAIVVLFWVVAYTKGV